MKSKSGPRLEHAESSWGRQWLAAWDFFWFTPQAPHTLAVIRIATGLMLAYVHLIWCIFATDFMGVNAWVDNATVQELRFNYAWTWLWYLESPFFLRLHEAVAMVAGLMMAVGCYTRWSIPAVWFLTLMTCHRMFGALFGLDQIVIFLSMYLMIAHSGSVYSFDAWLAGRRAGGVADQAPSVANNIATRLIQLHLCVIYIFGGLSKMRGEMWWDGSALWYTVVNYEYQSLDMTWLGKFPFFIALLTNVTIFWETFYCALVWPKLTRPMALALAVAVHGGIALALGMVTFGCIMIVANLSFIAPESVQRWVRFAARDTSGPSTEVGTKTLQGRAVSGSKTKRAL